MPRRKTNEEYIQECKDKGYDLPIEDYKGTHIKIKHKCSKGHIYKQKPSHHLRKQGCPVCKGGIRKNFNEYYKKCKKKGYDLPIEDYVNNHIKIKHKCKNGHIYNQSPSSHLQGNGCPYCAKNKKKTQKEYLSECKDKGYDLPIEDYINIDTKIKHKCNKGIYTNNLQICTLEDRVVQCVMNHMEKGLLETI